MICLLSQGTPPPNTAADTAHRAHSTQPALRPHRATPRVGDKPPQSHRPHSIGLCSPVSEGPDPGSADRETGWGGVEDVPDQPPHVAGLIMPFTLIPSPGKKIRHGDPCRYLCGPPPVSTQPVDGRASVGARASCLPFHRTRVRSARRGCH